MEPIITVNEYPIGWEWLDRVPLEDFTWLIEIFELITLILMTMLVDSLLMTLPTSRFTKSR